MRIRLSRVGTASIVAVVVAAGGVLVAQRWVGGGGAETRYIESSYYFDVSNRSYLAGFADAIVIGRVVEATKNDKSAGQTEYVVAVSDILKGALPSTIRVTQDGWRDGNVVYELRDQSTLVAGHEYLLVLGLEEQKGTYGVVGGPESVKIILSSTDATPKKIADSVTLPEVKAVWRDAIAQAQFPPGAP